jgi:hypothetical protein
VRINHGELLDRLTEWCSDQLVSVSEPDTGYFCCECNRVNWHFDDCLVPLAIAYIMQSRGWYHAPTENYVSNNP